MQEIADNGSNHFRFLELPRELQRKVITEAVIGFTTITLNFGYSEQCQCLLPVYRTTFPAALFLVSRLSNHDTKAVLAKDRGKIVELRSYLLWLYRDPPSASLKSFLIGVSTLRVQQLPLRQLKILVHALPNLRNVEASQPPFLEDYRPRLSKPIGLARNLFRGTSMMSVFSGEMDVVFAAEVQKEILQLMDPKDHIHLQNLCLKIPYRFRIKPIWSREWKDFMVSGPDTGTFHTSEFTPGDGNVADIAPIHNTSSEKVDE
ncbi:hypothetical protein PMZ80_001951 [Knufia obscura]|uniref:Uncharacterized protein n=1 Tax=Knufia obscura TaxID=1635080 RepID=A0ABR0RVX7_9EURO|nr:hypothetical protein PMZ80_001951 [Knufia obscura]